MSARIAALPAPARHLILAVAACLLSWAGTDAIPALSGQTGAASLLAGVVAALLAASTPLVQSYGLGRQNAYDRATR